MIAMRALGIREGYVYLREEYATSRHRLETALAELMSRDLTGQDITVSIALKPTSSIRLPRRTIDTRGQATTVETTGRHDPCVGIRATPIAEAMLALVVMEHALRHRAQCGDVRPPLAPIPAASR